MFQPVAFGNAKPVFQGRLQSQLIQARKAKSELIAAAQHPNQSGGPWQYVGLRLAEHPSGKGSVPTVKFYLTDQAEQDLLLSRLKALPGFAQSSVPGFPYAYKNTPIELEITGPLFDPADDKLLI